MQDKKNQVHWSFWAIGAFTLIWNLAGSVNFFAQMNPAILASYRPSEQLLVANRPEWATAAFALAVHGGSIGSILLMFRRFASFHLFVVSLAGVLATMVYSLGSGVTLSGGEIMGIVVMPIGVAAFLVWYARFAREHQWVR